MNDLYRLSDGAKDEEAIELLRLLQRSGVLIPVTVDYEAASRVFATAGYRNKGIRILLDKAVAAAIGDAL